MKPAPTDLFAAAEAALDRGDPAAAARLAEQGVQQCLRSRGGDGEAVPGWMVLAQVAADAGDDDRALELVLEVQRRDPGHPDAALLEARLRLWRWQLAEAERALQRSDETDEAPDFLHLRATLAELRGRQAEADRLYARAAAVDAVGFPAPVRMTDDEAHALLDGIVRSLPPAVIGTFGNLTIDLVDLPDPQRHQGADPETLGFYDGTPIGERTEVPIAGPDRIWIFKRNLERMAADREHLMQELRITLLHEVGHHLGWDEDDLEQRGLG